MNEIWMEVNAKSLWRWKDAICVCFSFWLSCRALLLRILFPFYQFQNTNSHNLLMWGKAEEGRRLRRPLPATSQLSTSKESSQLKISHCYIHTKEQWKSCQTRKVKLTWRSEIKKNKNTHTHTRTLWVHLTMVFQAS